MCRGGDIASDYLCNYFFHMIEKLIVVFYSKEKASNTEILVPLCPRSVIFLLTLDAGNSYWR